MSSVNINLLANLTGSAWSALMGLAFIPFYISLMGAEAYGLVGLFVSIQAAFAVLDLGMTQTLSREMARLFVLPDTEDRMRSTARTLEYIYWGVAVFVVIIISFGAYYVANYWLQPKDLSKETVMSSLLIMAFVIGLRWPQTLYFGGLNGLQRQLLVNGFVIFFSTLQGVGALIVLNFVEPTIEVFFLWQGLVALMQVLMMRVAFFRSLPKGRARFSKEILSSIWRFAIGMTGVSFFSTILAQSDKILLSKFLDLKEFGYYAFASTAAAVISKAVFPCFNAYLPRLTQANIRSDGKLLENLYVEGCELMALLIVPVTCLLAIFSRPILHLWTQNDSLVDGSSDLLSILVVGNAIAGMIAIPFALQLAAGWLKLGLYQNLIGLILFIPMVLISYHYWGDLGVAQSWVVVNLLCLCFGIHFMHKRLLSGVKWRWYRDAVILPWGTGFIVAGATYKILYVSNNLSIGFLELALAFFVNTIAVAMVMPGVRRKILGRLSIQFF